MVSTVFVVRVAGLEPTASRPPVKRATNCATPGYYAILFNCEWYYSIHPDKMQEEIYFLFKISCETPFCVVY